MIGQHLLNDPVLIVLLIASMVSWGIIIDCLLTLWRCSAGNKAFLRGHAVPDAPLAHLRRQLDQLSGVAFDRALTVLDTAITLQRQRMERALPLLGVIGTSAPFIGLLGTVIGILQAFQSIQAHNNMSPSVVSGGIATALVATAIGLAVAIPAVIAHHLLSSALSRQVAQWEAIVACWLPSEEGSAHEPISLV